jgi:hypothetical protein
VAPWIDLPAAERSHAQLRAAAERGEYGFGKHWDAIAHLARVAGLIVWMPAQGFEAV